MLKVIELFGGIGSPRKALEKLCVDFEIVDYVEIDQNAVNSYNHIFNENFKPQDITLWDKDIKCDLIFHGSPCQDFSTAGLNAGGNEGSGTRSSLLFETVRIVNKLKPKYVIWENVKNVLSKRHFETFEKYLNYMENLGYKNFYKILNSKDYGIPQHRERVFCISILNGNNYNFPKTIKLEKRLCDILENDNNIDKSFYLNEKQIKFLENTKFVSIKRINDPNGICHTLDTMSRGNREPKIYVIGNCMPSNHEAGRIISKDGIIPTLKYNHGTVISTETNLGIRKLTPLECWRLMGFDDIDYINAASKHPKVYKSHLYKQAGNSIVVNVLIHILRELNL